MPLFEDTNPRDLKELLLQIHNREAALPDFQRDFVWDPSATQDLVVSIANNYPAGSLLRIRNSRSLFACREFEGSPELNGYSPTFLVLDGQQRLTSLYQAFYGVGDHRYYLNLRALLDGADFEEAIFHLRTKDRRSRDLEHFDSQARELMLPLAILKGGSGGFSQWMLNVARVAGGADALAQLQMLGDIQQRWIQAIDDYRFPVVTLSDSTEADAVCTIFETLNRTGVKLSPFELLTARFWPVDIRLRQLWDEACSAHPVIADFEIDPYYVLQIIALTCRPTPSCKRGDVLSLTADDIRNGWTHAVRGLKDALQLMKEDCGVLVPKWLPYNTIVNPLASVLAKRGPLAGAGAAELRRRLVQWYWCAVLGQAYENAPNSQTAKDVQELSAWLDGGNSPAAVAGFRFDPNVLMETTARQRALYRGVIGLILRNHARDFHLDKPITGELIIDNHIDDHHIFPDAFVKRRADGLAYKDCVLNRTLIDRKTNIRISDRAPSDYMKEIHDARRASDSFETLLDSHLIPHGDGSPIWTDDFEAFLTARRQMLWDQIRILTGAG